MRSLKEISEWLSGLRGRRKTIIYVSEGIDYDITDVIRQYDAPSNSASALIDDIRQTINAAARSNVAIYAIDPRGLTTLGDLSIGVAGFADSQPVNPDAPGPNAAGIGLSGLRNELFLSQMNLRALAEETNGYAAVNSNDFTSAFDRIVRDNSSYYVLAYYPAQNRRDGKFHRIQVRVSRPGVTVRARRGYIAPRVRSVSARATPGASASAAVTEAINSPIAVSGISMRVFAAPFKGTAPNASVLFGVEMSGRDLSLDNGAKIEVAYFAVDASGKTRGGRSDTITLNLRPESRARVEENGLRFLNRLDLPPGRYTLRVAVRDVTGGNVGSLSYDLEVPDFSKSALSMSGLALTSMCGLGADDGPSRRADQVAAPGPGERPAHVPAERRARAARRSVRAGRCPAACRRHHLDRPLGRRDGGLQARGRASIERAAGRQRRIRLPGPHSADRSSTRPVRADARSQVAARRSPDGEPSGAVPHYGAATGGARFTG